MSTGQMKISVILPVRNCSEEQLRTAAASVLAQTWQNYEVLFIDDGSGEACAQLLDRIAQTDERFRVFHRENTGVSGARNFAIEMAQGDILTLLDDDDMLPENCFEEAAALLEDPELDAVWGGTCYLEEGQKASFLQQRTPISPDTGEVLKALSIPLDPGRIHRTRAECIGEPFRFEGGYINRGIAGRFIRREVFNGGAHRFPPGLQMYEDAVWNLEMLETTRICYVKKVWYYYFNHEASASNGFHADLPQRMEIPLERIRELLDLKNPVEYAAYTRLLMDSLRYVYKGMYGHPAWKPEPGEKKRLKRHLYDEEPWKEILSARFHSSADRRDRLKAELYRLHLLFGYWKLHS